jgi:hypothetical protein
MSKYNKERFGLRGLIRNTVVIEILLSIREGKIILADKKMPIYLITDWH